MLEILENRSDRGGRGGTGVCLVEVDKPAEDLGGVRLDNALLQGPELLQEVGDGAP